MQQRDCGAELSQFLHPPTKCVNYYYHFEAGLCIKLYRVAASLAQTHITQNDLRAS